MKNHKILSILQKMEPYYFYLFLFLNLLPLIAFKFFPTVDGPAHLYNSKLIVELLKNVHSPLHAYFDFNANINPNWTGHFLLAIFLSFVPAFMAEKLVLLFYLIGLPVSIRYLFKTAQLKNSFLLYMIFPFTYSFLFYYGFYNFNIGVVLFFICLGLWMKYDGQYTLKKWLLLSCLIVLMCLSHLFVFSLFVLTVFIRDASQGFNMMAQGWRNIRYKFSSLILGVLIMLNYLFLHSKVGDKAMFLPFYELIQLIIHISPAKGIHYGKAAIYTPWILYAFSLLFLYPLIVSMYAYIRYKKKMKVNHFWLFTLMAIALLIFILPDSKGAEIGFMSARLIYFFFLFLCIYLATQTYPIWIKIIVFLVVNYVNFAFIKLHYLAEKKSSSLANEISALSNYIEPHSIILPITFSDYFINAHLSNYLGANKPLIILENYEASMGHFPLRWKSDFLSDFKFGKKTCNEKYLSWFPAKETASHDVDYLLLISDEAFAIDRDCSQAMQDEINENYQMIFTNKEGSLKLYKKRFVSATILKNV